LCELDVQGVRVCCARGAGRGVSELSERENMNDDVRVKAAARSALGNSVGACMTSEYFAWVRVQVRTERASSGVSIG
jgi:hypothetical protein